jgi:hypothetical protein
MTKRRPIPEPILHALREHFPRLIHGEMEGENVLLLMADDKGRPDEAVHYVASPGFMTAVQARNPYVRLSVSGSGG